MIFFSDFSKQNRRIASTYGEIDFGGVILCKKNYKIRTGAIFLGQFLKAQWKNRIE